MMLQYLDYFSQFVITCTGMGSLYFMASQSPRDRLKGGLIGLFGEPFWFFTAYINWQPGILALAFIYAVAWIRVVWSNYKEVYGDPYGMDNIC